MQLTTEESTYGSDQASLSQAVQHFLQLQEVVASNLSIYE